MVAQFGEPRQSKVASIPSIQNDVSLPSPPVQNHMSRPSFLYKFMYRVHPARTEREFFIENLLVRIHLLIEMSRWTGHAPWEFEFPFSGSLTSTFLDPSTNSCACSSCLFKIMCWVHPPRINSCIVSILPLLRESSLLGTYWSEFTYSSR